MSDGAHMPFVPGRFYDVEAVAWAFASSGGAPVSTRTVQRWLGRVEDLERVKVCVGGRSWWPGAALAHWAATGASERPAVQRDAARGVFIPARTEGQLRRKVSMMEPLEVSNG